MGYFELNLTSKAGIVPLHGGTTQSHGSIPLGSVAGLSKELFSIATPCMLAPTSK
jgi:hypothetical protein